METDRAGQLQTTRALTYTPSGDDEAWVSVPFEKAAWRC